MLLGLIRLTILGISKLEIIFVEKILLPDSWISSSVLTLFSFSQFQSRRDTPKRKIPIFKRLITLFFLVLII